MLLGANHQISEWSWNSFSVQMLLNWSTKKEWLLLLLYILRIYVLHQTKQHPDIAEGQIHSPMVCESSQQIGTVQERERFMASSDHFDFYLTLYESLLLVPSPKIHLLSNQKCGWQISARRAENSSSSRVRGGRMDKDMVWKRARILNN